MLDYFFFIPSRFQCIQACDYDETKLVTGENLVRHRKKKFAHLSLKHITLLGIVRLKQKDKKKKNISNNNNAKSKRASLTTSEPIRGRNAFLFDEAAVNENDDEDYDNEDEEDEEDDDDDDDLLLADAQERGMSASEYDSDSEAETEQQEQPSGDISEQLVQEEEAAAAAVEVARSDHTYSSVADFNGDNYSTNRSYKTKMLSANWRKKARYRYSFLYSVSVSGVGKKIKNCIPKAVAILSNSKTIILNHVNVMLECLDPALAELCYMDTDSCLFSFTHLRLEDNLLDEKREEWAEANILADESGPQSCHGKLKLEGTFRVGLFKALKIYRLFSSRDFEREQKEKICYTRCKGVNRNIAKIIPNVVFERETVDKTVVHRSCLRPSRTGEMLIAHECKSLAAPFNLKRHVTADGLHSFPVSYVADEDDDVVDEDGANNNGQGEGGDIHGDPGEAL